MLSKIYCFFLVFISFLNINAQVFDDFSQFQYFNKSLWRSDTASFLVTNQELKSNNNIANATFIISHPNVLFKNAEWNMDVKMSFNPSSNNYIDWIISADSFNLKSFKNGYFIRLGGSTDEISLFRVNAGIETKVIDGTDGILNTSNNLINIALINNNDTFTLKRKTIGSNVYVTEGVYIHNATISTINSGIRIRQSTASFFNRHSFDNYYIGKIIKDTVAPVLDSFIALNPNTIRLVFSENIDSLSVKDSSNYTLSPKNNWIESIQIINSKTIQLIFKDSFTKNTLFNLTTQGIADFAANKILPQSNSFIFYQTQTPQLHDLIINELMIKPDPVVGLANKEYIEIKNISKYFLSLKQCVIKDLTSFKNLPNLVLHPDSFLVLYDIPTLNNAGDHISLWNANQELIHQVSYTDQWYQDSIKSNGGWSIELKDQSQLCLKAENWAASIHPLGGTPGFENSIKQNLPIDRVGPQIFSFEFENDSILNLTFNESFDSLSLNNLQVWVDKKAINYKIDSSKTKEQNMSLWLDFEVDKTKVQGFKISGLRDCVGNMMSDSFDWQMLSLCQRQEIVINELLFNPKTNGKDFVELYNNSPFAFDMSQFFLVNLDANNAFANYCSFPKSMIVKPYQYVLISEDTNNICSFYQCKNKNALKIKVSRLPSMPDDEGNIILINLNNQIIDSIRYQSSQHAAMIKDQNGISLERLSFDKNLWYSASSSAGFATPGYQNSQQLAVNNSNQMFALQSETLSPDNDGFEDFLSINYNLEFNDAALTVEIYDKDGRFVKQLKNNELVANQGEIIWDGTDFNNQRAAIGIYIIYIKGFSASQSAIFQKKMTCVLALKF